LRIGSFATAFAALGTVNFDGFPQLLNVLFALARAAIKEFFHKIST
jgi:hypothetical protein